MGTLSAHEGHEERFDLESCAICRAAFDAAASEHAWMRRAIKGDRTNPYAPGDPQAPERDWYLDESGYVKVDA